MELFMRAIVCLRLEMGVMNLRIKILKQGKKNEVVIVQNEEESDQEKIYQPLLGESVETEDPVLAMQYESYEHEKNDHNCLD